MAEFFYDEQAERAYAVVLGKAILVLEGDRWEVHPAGGRRWDALHQKIYRDGRWIEALPRLAWLRYPRLPDLSAVQPIDPSLEAGAGAHLLAADLPHLAAAVPEGTTAALSVALIEDRWETRHGDGEFHYPRLALLDAAAVRRLTPPREGVRWHCRQMTIAHHGGQLTIPDFALARYDQCTLAGLLKLAEAQLAAPPT